MWELECKEIWVQKNWCFWTVVLEKTLESPLDCKIKPVNLKGNHPWIFTGCWSWNSNTLATWFEGLIGKDPDAGKNWKQEEKGMMEDEMVGWHRWLNGHEFEQALGVGAGQGGLACCSPWGHKESYVTDRPNWTDLCCWNLGKNDQVLKTDGLRLWRYWNLNSSTICNKQ